MALLNQEIISNYSCNISACNLSSTGHIDWRISTCTAVVQFLLGLFDLFTVLYLSLVLKKRAWDSPAKRFGHSLNLYFAFAFLFFAIVHLSTSPKKIIWPRSSEDCTLQFYRRLFKLNFAALLVPLSLQIVAPFFPERIKKQCACRSHCVHITEVVLHVLFLSLLILSAIFSHCKSLCECVDDSLIIVACFSTIVLFLSFATIVFTYIKFFKNPNINKNIKYVILKLVFTIITCILFLIAIFISSSQSSALWHLHSVLYFFLTSYSKDLGPQEWPGGPNTRQTLQLRSLCPLLQQESTHLHCQPEPN